MTAIQKKLRIAHFTDTFYPKIDGIVTFLDNSIYFLSKRGHKAAVFCPRYGKHKEKYFGGNVKIFRLRSIPLHTYKEVKIAVARPKKIFQQLKEFNPDIIHIHAPGTIGLLGILAARKLHVPLIGTYHTLVSEQVDYISLGNILGLNKLTEKIYRIFKKDKLKKKPKDNSRLKRLIWYISLKMYGRCNVIIAPSKSIADLLKSKLKRDIEYVCSGIDLKKFQPRKIYSHAGTLSFLHVGRLSFEKRIDILLKAFYMVNKRYNADFKVNIVGDGPARKYLENTTRTLKLEEKVHFTGKVSDNVLKRMYQESDVFVTASAMETLGMVILESLASGTPVIAVRKYAVPDIVKDGINGYLAEPYSAESFSEAIMKIIRNRSRIPHFGRQGVKIARKCELGKNMKKLESVYLRAMRLYGVRH